MKKRAGTNEIKEILKKDQELCQKYTITALMNLYKYGVISCPLTDKDRENLEFLKSVWGRTACLRSQIKKVPKDKRMALLNRAEFTKPEEYLFKTFYRSFEMNITKSKEAKGHNYSVEDIVGWAVAHFRIKETGDALKFRIRQAYKIKQKARDTFRKDSILAARKYVPVYEHVVFLIERFLREGAMTPEAAALFAENLLKIEGRERLVLKEAKVALTAAQINRLKDSLMKTAMGDEDELDVEEEMASPEIQDIPATPDKEDEGIPEENPETPYWRVIDILKGDIKSLSPKMAKALDRELSHLFKKDPTIADKFRLRRDLITAYEALAEQASKFY